MTVQLSIFDVLRVPPTIRRIDPDGQVVQGKPHRTFTLPHSKHRYGHSCRFELHQAGDGSWMWSTSFTTDDGCYSGYRVGEKWGKFAASPDDALHYAREELRERLAIHGQGRKGVTRILAWADALTLEAADA